MPSLVFVSFAAASAPHCPTAPREDPVMGPSGERTSSAQGQSLPSRLSQSQAKVLSLQEQANTVDETGYLCSPAVGQAEAHVFMRTGRQAAS